MQRVKKKPVKEKRAVTLVKFMCLRCEWVWIPRTEKPAHCPKCKSPYWNKYRQKDYLPKARKNIREKLTSILSSYYG